jgi:hypothetical protein
LTAVLAGAAPLLAGCGADEPPEDVDLFHDYTYSTSVENDPLRGRAGPSSLLIDDGGRTYHDLTVSRRQRHLHPRRPAARGRERHRRARHGRDRHRVRHTSINPVPWVLIVAVLLGIAAGLATCFALRRRAPATPG